MADLLTPALARAVKIKGTVRQVNILRKTCEILTSSGRLIVCAYDPRIEEEIEDAINFVVVAQGVIVTSAGRGRKSKRIVISSIKIKELDFEAAGIKRRSIQDLLNSEIVGMWKDRDDLDDDFVRRLRE